jgi:hypothetical protein
MSKFTITFAELAERLNEKAEDFAREVIGENPTQRVGATLRFMSRGRLAVTVRGAKQGRWKHFSEDVGGDMIDLYMWKTGAGKTEAAAFARSWLGLPETDEDGAVASDAVAKFRESRPSKEDNDRLVAEEEAKTVRVADWLWTSSSVKISDAVTEYLAGRGIVAKLPASIRTRSLDANAMRKIGVDPAAVPAPLDAAVFVATAADGTVRAVQQVLVKNGKKAPVDVPKRTNGKMNGAAVRLAEPKDVLIIAEGPETGLSCWQATEIPTWITLGSANFIHAPVPDSVTDLIIAVDREPWGAGVAAALRADHHWRGKGKRVHLAFPNREEGDMNDELQNGGEEAVRKIFAAKETAVVAAGMEGVVVVCKAPRDGLAIWRSAGVPTIPTGTGTKVHPEFHFPENADDVILVLEPEDRMPELETILRKRPKLRVRILRPSRSSVAAIFERGGREAVLRLLSMACPPGKEPLYGFEELAASDAAPVILHQTRAGADALGTDESERSNVAWNLKLDRSLYDWTPLKGRNVIIAPLHCRAGLAGAAEATETLTEIGASAISVIEWPLFAPDADGTYVVRHRKLPKSYSMLEAAADGWTGKRVGELVALAVPVL